MGDVAKAKRREQLKRWSGSSTDREPAVPRQRWRGDVVDTGESEAVGVEESEGSQDADGNGSTTAEHQGSTKQTMKRRRRVRFERTAEFLAVCASGDTEEAGEMLKEAKGLQIVEPEINGGIVNCSNADGITALHQACIDGSMEVVAFLLLEGAHVNQVDSEGWTPLHVAASCGNLDITEFLLDQGASLSAVNCDGDVPLDIAEDEATETLLQEHTQKQGVDLVAAKRAEEEQIMGDARQWLTEGLPADVHNARTGATPLHVAAAKGYLEAIKLLCQCGLDVSAVDVDGWTPLHAAAHWGQGEACRILAEQLCDMEARSAAGQTPFDVADESVEALLEELSQTQANWRNERSNNDPQNAPAAANAPGKKRRTSVCRMSSRDKMNVQDQSKERGISGGLDMNEERESSPESSTVSSPDSESITTSTTSPAEKTADEKEPEEKDQDLSSRTARVQPTPQKRESPAESPSNAVGEGRKFKAPARDEESESQRKARSRLMRQSRRSTQGVTLTELKEAERIVGRPSEPSRSVQSVSPIVTVTPAERDTDPVKQGAPEEDNRLSTRERRRKERKERRSTGVVQFTGETEDADASEDARPDNTAPEPQSEDSSTDYRVLYSEVLTENALLRDKLQETQLLLSESKVELERLRQSQENGSERPALLELEQFEKKVLQRRAAELEDELKVLVDLRSDNQRLKDENAALIRVISKLSR
ncbi:protein phosphatase 1 regulatory subunit 12C [Sardina pilchardus]|uniref:protein phosphatase 1 regulatory subunit 12C n=1 Tax=Sardina pilchardus TaxID=27697 RepID=UPI002E154339